MNHTEVSSRPGSRQRESAAELQAAAGAAYQQSLTDGGPLTGSEIGGRFGRSARWGRARIAEWHAANSDHAQTRLSGSDGNAVAPSGGNGGSRDAAQLVGTSGSYSVSAAATGANGRGERGAQEGVPDATATRLQANDANGPTITRAVRRTTTLAVVAVAVVAAVASFDHQRELAEIAGEGWRSWLLPISVDGLVVAASMSLLVHRRGSQPVRLLAWLALLLGLGASLAANVVAVDDSLVDLALVRRVIAAWPPAALGISFELLLGVVRPGPSDGR